MNRSFFAAAAAALLATTGCNQIGASGSAAAQVNVEELRAAVADEPARRFYEARNWQAVWDDGRAQTLNAALDEAPRHGLDRSGFAEPIEAAQTPAQREAAMTRAALAYADALARGLTDPDRVADIYTLARPEFDAAAALNRALGEDRDLAQFFASLAPQDEEYRALSEAFLHYAGLIGEQEGGGIPAGDAISPGGADPRIPRIAQALRAGGYLPEPQGEAPPQARAPDAGARYTPEMVAAVRRLQQEFGREADGVIGNATLELLNQGARERARILAVNLERRRWLERQAPSTRIDVNVAAAQLAYVRDGAVADRRAVIVGQPGNETPQLGSPIYRLVANPTWTVPTSIAEEEILPLGSGYMRRNNMTMRDGMVVQASGPSNALGLVKFDMRNDHAIYLHDTPAKALFGEDERYFSHGCVRVQDALGFAQMLAEHQGVTDEWNRARSTGEETFVPLPQAIPVRLLYHTAVLENGRVVFRPDPYGWDNRLALALGREAPQAAAQASRKRPHYRDVGP